MVDAEGNGNGTIDKEEFAFLSKRLNYNLTTHRIDEIFAKVKTTKSDTAALELNAAEFEKALDYLNEKAA